MKVVYHYYYDGYDDEDESEIGEVEGMFDENNELLGTWACNDGNWRNEYFDGFLRNLGIDIQQTPEDREAIFAKILKENWAPNYIDDENDDC